MRFAPDWADTPTEAAHVEHARNLHTNHLEDERTDAAWDHDMPTNGDTLGWIQQLNEAMARLAHQLNGTTHERRTAH